MGDVVRPNFSKTADLSVEQVLRRSLEKQFDAVVVLGFDADGELHAFCSSSDSFRFIVRYINGTTDV